MIILAVTIWDWLLGLIVDTCCRCTRISHVSNRWTETAEVVIMESVAETAWLPADKCFRSISHSDTEILQRNVWKVAAFNCCHQYCCWATSHSIRCGLLLLSASQKWMHANVAIKQTLSHLLSLTNLPVISLKCYDAAGWASGRAYSTSSLCHLLYFFK